MPPESCHVSVLPREIVEWVGQISPRVIIDGTYGGGGHARRLLACLPPGEGVLIGLDRDPAVSERFEQESNDPRLTLFLGSYEHVPRALDAMNVPAADAMVLDLGLSSDQLADAARGFSFTRSEAPLDLRFDPETGIAAADWLARHSETEIADVIYRYGEERCSRPIAKEIVARRRREDPVRTVGDLEEICYRYVRRSRHHDIHPATRTFQALRIAVNDELGILERDVEFGAAVDGTRGKTCGDQLPFTRRQDRQDGVSRRRSLERFDEETGAAWRRRTAVESAKPERKTSCC